MSRMRLLIVDLNEKFSNSTRSISCERNFVKSLIPLTIIGGGKLVVFQLHFGID